MTDAVRLVVGTLTAIPVRPPERVDRRVAGVAVAFAPAVGGVLGAVAALVLWVCGQVFDRWLSAVLAVAVLALLTRLIHWDGLADLADGLGSARSAEDTLAIMRRSDIGPFGVVAIVLVLAVQVAAVAELGPVGLVAGVVLGRWGLVVACRAGVPPARPTGLGATVAGSATWPLLLAAAVSTALLLTALSVAGSLAVPAVVVATATTTIWAAVLTALAVRRLGGITGDVLGAVAETTTAIALLALAAW